MTLIGAKLWSAVGTSEKTFQVSSLEFRQKPFPINARKKQQF